MGVTLGEEVGYCIRFDDKTSSKTKLKYLTDGMLLREAMLDPLLSKYGVIILDEAHERTVQTDILFGLIKQIQDKRKDLKVIVMSATLESELFSTYFKADVMHIPGRQHQVDIFYTTTPESDYLDAAVITVLQIHIDEPLDDGASDILLFLTGREEIESLEKILNEKVEQFSAEIPKLLCCPLYSGLPSSEQLKAFQPSPKGCRKVILATNIAETSVTINGIRYVIDTGMVKSRIYNAKTGIESLQVTPISKAASRQRSGRAGRERHGVCYRLFTENSFEELDEQTIAEIRRTNLSSVILQMKSIGIEEIFEFPYIEKPPVASIRAGLTLLYTLGALTSKGTLSELGKKIALFPVDPSLGKVLLTANNFGCTEEVLSIVAMLSTETDSIFFTPKSKKKEADAARKRFLSVEGDHFTFLNIFTEYNASKKKKKWCVDNFINMSTMKKAEEIRNQLKEYGLANGISLKSAGTDFDKLKKCFITGYFNNVAKLELDGTYKTLVHNKTASIHPSSVLFQSKSPLVLFAELIFTKRQYMRNAMVVEPQWLPELAPMMYDKKEQ